VRVLAFRHAPFEHLGLVGDALDAHGIAYDYVDLDQAPAFQLPVQRAGALIFLGGSMSANDDLPYIRREIRLIREAISNGRPVLGVCLGSQLIAKALGAKIYSNAVKEIGWAPVTFTDAARRDPLFAGLAGPEVICHWHGETFDLPSGAERLASSANCQNQAFRWGDRVYGLQFHLEVTPEMIAQWCVEDAKCGEKREVTDPIDPQAHAARAQELARLVFGRWCDLVKGQNSACGASS
jgi:GMP synthase (glutamine-hydrolysing)